MDFLLKKTIVKFASKSKKFADLAANNTICIVLIKQTNLQKAVRKNQSSLIKNHLFYGTDWESTENNFGLEKKLKKLVCADIVNFHIE